MPKLLCADSALPCNELRSTCNASRLILDPSRLILDLVSLILDLARMFCNDVGVRRDEILPGGEGLSGASDPARCVL